MAADPLRTASTAKHTSRRPKPSATIVPFPSVRCRDLCERPLIAADSLNDDAAVDYLRDVVRERRTYLESIGVAPEQVAADTGELAQVLLGEPMDQAS